MNADVPALIGAGYARSAEISGRSGPERLHLQKFSENTPVYDVGRVDEYGIRWISPVTATFIQGMGRNPKILAEGETVTFHKHAFGAPGNLLFDVDVFAPALTPLAGAMDRSEHAAMIDALGLRVETDALPVDSRNVPLALIRTFKLDLGD